MATSWRTASVLSAVFTAALLDASSSLITREPVQVRTFSMEAWIRPVRLKTYVINKASRVDRRKCMQHVLASAPLAPQFEPAVDGADWEAYCGNLVPEEDAAAGMGHNSKAERGLFCSNYRIWTRANASDADFVIILEDDVFLEADFWEKASDFLSTCGGHFDMIVVDPHHIGDVGQRQSCEGGRHQLRSLRTPALLQRTAQKQILFPGANAGKSFGNSLGFWGTHVQIIRKSYLNTLIAEAERYGIGAVDKWWVLHSNGRKAAWAPGLARQMRFVSEAENPCRRSVARSDISEASIVAPGAV